MRIIFSSLIFFLAALFLSTASFACDSCGAGLARISSAGKLEKTEKPVFFDFTMEQIVWHKRDAGLAHTLHHQGHDSHVKTHEEFYHFGLGANLGERISVFAEIPYVVRHSLDIDSHAFLGSRQRSEGFGDLRGTVILKALKKSNFFLGPLAGIKLPTGNTAERDDHGVKFEPEMQSGSGSVDPFAGAAFQYRLGPVEFNGNAIYTIRTEGAQEFRFGNLFSTYLYADYLINPDSRYFKSKLGLDTTLHSEQKQRNRQGPVADSGGTTWLLGPQFSIQGNEFISVFGNILFPIYQNLGGVHQQLRYIWNAGVKISF